MRKILSILTLLLCAVGGAWADGYTPTADEVIILKDVYSASATSSGYSTHLAVAWGGTASTNSKKAGDPNNGGAATSSNVPCYSVKGNGGGKNITISISGVSKIIVYHESHSSRYVELRSEKADGALIGAGSAATYYTEVELDGTKSYSIFLHGTGTGSDNQDFNIYAVKLFKYESKTVLSTTLSGININGTAWDTNGLSGNAATISDEYAGPPTVDFVYVENYSDYTSSSNKTESVVAVKDNGSYKAVSTVLTENVTLTFSNVSNVLFSMTDPTAPTEALASKASSDVTATFSPGGSAIVYNGHSSSAAQMVYADQINLNGSGSSYFQANFTASLAEGDVITSSNTNAEIFKIGINSTAGNATKVTFPYTIPNGSNLIGKKTVYVFKNSTPATFATFTITRPKTIDNQEFAGVKEGATTLTETTDYTVSGTIITLTEAHKAAVAPTDIKLINHITYDDATTDDVDVDVTLAKNVDFFEGTATIGATTYTVQVPVDASTPVLTLSATSGSISLNSYTPTGSVKVTLTGDNLAEGTYDAPTAEGVTITPATYTVAADGTANQEFTITSTANTAASTDIVFAYTGAESKTYTLTYTKAAKRELTQTDVTGAITWDWKKSGGASIQLSDATDPTNSTEFLLAALPEITNDGTFNSQALKVVCQWPNRGTDYYFQGHSVKFNTTVPGTVQVWFSNTSNRQDNATNRRFLYVNGVNSDVYTLNQTFTNTDPMTVSAGEVIINAFTGEDTPASTMVRINKIVFIPVTTINLNASGYATYSNYYDVEVSGANAYTATLDIANSKITCAAVADNKVPAGAGVLLYGDASAEVTLTPTTGVSALSSNDLKGTTDASGNLVAMGANDYYVLSGDTFKKFTGSAFAANKAYFEVSSGNVLTRNFTISFEEGEATAIKSVGTDSDTVMKKYVKDGRLVIENANGVFTAAGTRVK